MARPFGTLKYNNVEDLQKGIDNYFVECEVRKAPYTMSGLAYALDISRQTLLNYKNTDSYFDAISRARVRCEQYSAECLFDRDKVNGAKFDLANNHGMSERSQLDIGNKDGQPLQLASLSDDTLKIRLIALGLISIDRAASDKIMIE